MYNPFVRLKKHEWLLWAVSLVIVSVSNLLAGQIQPATLSGTLVGVTALIFVAKGDVWGQILIVIFSLLYAVTSYEFRYYGEMITYLGMTMSIAVLSIVSWLRNPFEKGKNEVKIHRLTRKQICIMIASAIAVTWIFYYILKAFHTANLLISTASVTTSFLASYLMLYRNSCYALAYAANDIVLIFLWILASVESTKYFPMVVCFFMFFINDLYGFASWKIREKKQGLREPEK